MRSKVTYTKTSTNQFSSQHSFLSCCGKRSANQGTSWLISKAHWAFCPGLFFSLQAYSSKGHPGPYKPFCLSSRGSCCNSYHLRFSSSSSKQFSEMYMSHVYFSVDDTWLTQGHLVSFVADLESKPRSPESNLLSYIRHIPRQSKHSLSGKGHVVSLTSTLPHAKIPFPSSPRYLRKKGSRADRNQQTNNKNPDLV